MSEPLKCTLSDWKNHIRGVVVLTAWTDRTTVQMAEVLKISEADVLELQVAARELGILSEEEKQDDATM